MSVFYFGIVPEEFQEDHANCSPKDWEPEYYYRIRVVDDEIKLEDSCGRMIPFLLSDIKGLRRTLKTIRKLYT